MTYTDYLRQTGEQLLYGAGVYWTIYRNALIPASPLPTFIDVDLETSKRLLVESGAYLIRWTSDPTEKETPWWWLICDEYDLTKFPSKSKIRNEVKRGYRRCVARRVSAEWLAEFGYDCYRKAFRRYLHAKPVSREEFKSSLLVKSKYEALFEYWGVFVKDHLVGYNECIVEGSEGVAFNVGKYDPDYLKDYPIYALTDTLLTEYVVRRNLPITVGTRNIAHQTHMQDFLLKFGFRRLYCRLNVQYKRSLGLAISLAFPLRAFVPDWGMIHNIKVLLFQEELRRACQNAQGWNAV